MTSDPTPGRATSTAASATYSESAQSARPADLPPEPALTGLDALAFATDVRSERALRAGLAECQDAQVWPGDLRAAATALAGGISPRLLFVDLDQTSYPAGAIYELAAVCEVDTAVVALGSDGTARFSREILLAGVSDYLVKPITAAAVREAAVRAAGTAPRSSGEGWLVGFAGTGGSGATTLAAAVALLAAERGRYVSVLDLNRTFPALSFLLDVEPAGGLVDLLSTVARASLHPEMVESMRASRSDRIAVYGYPWSAVPPPLAPVWAVCELFVELQRRSHLVIVDGMDDPATRHTLLAMVDARVFVVEPTAAGAVRAAHLLARLGPMLGPEWPCTLVQNHTRAFQAKAGARALRGAGVALAPDVVVPFEPTLPSITDRGWPENRIPRSQHDSLTRLTDLILAPTGAAATPEPAPAPQAASRSSRAPGGRRRRSPSSSARAGSSPVRAALRRLLPFRSGPRPA